MVDLALLSDEELGEVVGDGTCMHLPHVRMALELQGHRAALQELRRLLARMPGGDDLRRKNPEPAEDSMRQPRCGWCFSARGLSREAVQSHLVTCKLNPLVGRDAFRTRDLEHNWKLISPAEKDDPTESETHRCEVCGLQRLSEWGTLPTFYRKTSSRWERVEDSACLGHSVGALYQAVSDCGQGCPHPTLELRGLADCWAIACVRCGKRWCNEVLDCAALSVLVAPDGATEPPAESLVGR
jgi:hypothetical protein